MENSHRLHADPRHPTEQVNDWFLVVGKPVAVELFPDCRIAGGSFLVFLQDPFQRRTVAQPIIPCLRRNALQPGHAVDFDHASGLVGLETRFGRHRRRGPVIPARQRPRLYAFKSRVQCNQRPTPRDPLPEIGIKREAGKFGLEIQRIGFPIGGIVQHCVDVIENILFFDRLILIMGAEPG